MAFDFPSSPTTGQTYSITGGPTYVYNGTAWVVLTPGNQFNRTVFTATAGQTTFTMNYVVGAIDVYRNGVKLAPADFTATNGTSIVLLNAATVGDTIEVISYPMITYSDAVKRTGDTMTGALTVPMVVTESSLGLRNRLINGDMRIDQRTAGASTSIAVGDGVTFLPDRWRFQKSSSSYGSTAQLSATAPEGFTSSLLVTVTSAFSPAAGDYFTVGQKIEGTNYSDFQFGNAVAKSITVSFWVRSSVTGSYAVSLSNANNYNRFIVKTITINAANTWEYKTLTFPGDTTGTWGISSSDSLYLRIDLGSGSSFNAAAADAWSSSGFRLSSTSNFASNAGATFYLTGAQLEIGSVATPFERRLYGQELAFCKRYRCRIGFAVDAENTVYSAGTSPISMRATPSHVSTVYSGYVSNINFGIGVNGVAVLYSSPDQVGWQIARAVAGRFYAWGDMILDAEL